MTQIKYIAVVALLAISSIMIGQQTNRLVIMHTNDTHSQVEPDGTDMGGYARRKGVIDSIRSVEKNTLLLDAGDYFQGSPYFNFFNGRVEIEAMNMMGYDVVTLGNHEFDNGIDSLLTIVKLAKFPIVNSNYDLEKTNLKGYIKPYTILNKNGVRVGVFGIGVNPQGLIIQRNYEGMTYSDPVKKAEEMSNFLKNEKKCDVIICLSHIGCVAESAEMPTDFDVAANSENIDVIISGHSHKLLENANPLNKIGKPVIIAQMQKGGRYLGIINLTLSKEDNNGEK